MRRVHTRSWLFAPLAVVLVGVASAGQADTRGFFVRSFVETLNSRKPELQKPFVLPRSRVCATGTAVSFFDELFPPRVRPLVPADYRWEITQVAPGAQPLFADEFDYPVLPTHLLKLDFETGSTSSTTLVVQLATQGDEWYVVAACPKRQAASAASALSQARVERAQKVNELATSIESRLKEAVLRLVKEGRKIDAITEYQKATGVDLGTARDVVELMTARSRWTQPWAERGIRAAIRAAERIAE